MIYIDEDMFVDLLKQIFKAVASIEAANKY